MIVVSGRLISYFPQEEWTSRYTLPFYMFLRVTPHLVYAVVKSHQSSEFIPCKIRHLVNSLRQCSSWEIGHAAYDEMPFSKTVPLNPTTFLNKAADLCCILNNYSTYTLKEIRNLLFIYLKNAIFCFSSP